MADGQLIRQKIDVQTTKSNIEKGIADIQNQQLKAPVPTLFIAIGGTGKDILLRLRKKFFLKYGAVRNNDTVKNIPAEYLYYDLDKDWKLNDDKNEYGQEYFKNFIDFDESEKINVTGDVKELREKIEKGDPRYKKLFDWCSTSLDSSITSGTGASRNRQFSRLAFFQHYLKINEVVKRKIENLKKIGMGEVKIVLLFSIAGGTGCGSFLDLAFLCRKLIRSNPLSKVDAHIILPGAFSSVIGKQADMNYALGNGYAALKEIEYYTKLNKFRAYWNINEEPEEMLGPIFNSCYLVSNQNDREFTFNGTSLFDIVADYLFYDTDTDYIFGPARRSIVNNLQNYLDDTVASNVKFTQADDDKTFIDLNSFSCHYSTYGISKITIPSNLIKKLCSAKAAIMLVEALQTGADVKFNEQLQIKEAEDFCAEHFVSNLRECKLMNNITGELNKTVNEFIDKNLSVINTAQINSISVSYDGFINKFEEEIFKSFIQNSTKIIKTNFEDNVKASEPFEVKAINEKILSFLEPPDSETNDKGDTIYKPFGIAAARSFLSKVKEKALKYCETFEKEKKSISNFDEIKKQISNFIEDRNKKIASVKTVMDELKKWLVFKSQWEQHLFPIYGKPAIDKNIRTNKKYIEETTKINIGEIKKLLFDYALNKFLVSFFIDYVVKVYYQDFVLLLLGENEITEKIVPPFIKLNEIDKNLDSMKNYQKDSFKAKWSFYENNFSFSEHEEVLNSSKEHYYKLLTESFEKPEKLRQFCRQWKETYYVMSKNEVDKDNEIKKFIYEILGKPLSENSMQSLINSVADVCQSVINNLADSKNISDIYSNAKNVEVKSKLPYLIRKSMPCLYATEKFLFQDQVDCFRLFGTIMLKDNLNDTKLNHFKPFFNDCDSNIKQLESPPKKFDMIQRLMPYPNKEASDTILFFSEMHGFPLCYINLIQEEMRNKYFQLSSSERGNNSKNPLHIESNEDRFVDLIPILDSKGTQDYRNVRKLELLGVLFDILKYDPQKKEYKFLYTKPGSTAVNNSIKTGINFKDSIRPHEEFLRGKINEFKLSNNGEYKFYMTLLYLEKLIQYNFPKTYKSVGAEHDRQKLSSVIYSIIIEEKDKLYDKIKSNEEKLKNELYKDQYKALDELADFETYEKDKEKYDEKLREVFKDILNPISSNDYYMVKLNLNDTDLI